jgi:hypothetical protein
MKDDSSDVFQWLETRLNIPVEYTASLMSGNDWMFIVKLHALIETALNHVIPIRLGVPSLESIIERLETSNAKSGKIAFARRLGLLPTEAAKFIQYLSELRNTCAHLPRTYNFNLRDHVAALAPKPKRDWLEKVNFKLAYPLRFKPGTPDQREEFLANPRLALFRATLAVVMYLHCEWIKADYEGLKDIVDWLQKKRPIPRFPEGFHEPSRSKVKKL